MQTLNEWKEQRYQDDIERSGPSLERVPWVPGHPLRFGNGCQVTRPEKDAILPNSKKAQKLNNQVPNSARSKFYERRDPTIDLNHHQEKLGTLPVKTLTRPLKALSQKLSVYGKRMYTCFRVRRGSLVKISILTQIS